jgi:hypothetical protein
MVLLRRKASWTVTNARAGGLPGVELVPARNWVG